MRPTRVPGTLVVPFLLLALAACGGSSPAASTGGGSSSEPSTAAASQAEASQAEQSASESKGSTGNAGDVQSIADALVPPNSSEVSKTTASGAIFVTYQSTDSPDSLKSFYENAIPGTGMTIFSTTTVSGAYTWLFAESESSSFGGSVTVGPADTGGSGSSVIIAVSQSE